ncbi:MAG: thioredoxin family protein [Deltaproteobacteria bacterium]|nr:thioredoxin family protein [Deltaproteobacteria bacterium]
MVLLKSIDIPLGTKLPSFTLPDPNGQNFKSQNLFGPKGLLLAVTCNHCPYAIAVWPRFLALANHAKELGINTTAINPNIHPDYPDDAPDKMAEKIKEWNINFPYLVDESQELAKELKAQCTPDIYLYDGEQKLVYHGRIDDNWQDESQVTKEELKQAINALAQGKVIEAKQHPSMGCSIKWK